VKGIFVDTLSRLSSSIMIHLGELQYLKGLLERDTLTEILLDYPDSVDPEDIEDWSKSDSFGFRDIVDIVPKESILEDIYGFLRIINGFSIMVITVTLVICLVFTSAIFMISAKERSRDTSILRAIGIPSWRIFQWVIMESALFYSLGAIMGIAVGMLSIRFLNIVLVDRFPLLPADFDPFRMDPTVLLIAFGASFLLALISALLPAIRSATISPMASMRGDIS
jgi:ABC-type antimicrobial peptide transport system permease subunit